MPKDYTLTIDGEDHVLTWDRPMPPTQADIEPIVAQFRQARLQSNAVGTLDALSPSQKSYPGQHLLQGADAGLIGQAPALPNVGQHQPSSPLSPVQQQAMQPAPPSQAFMAALPQSQPRQPGFAEKVGQFFTNRDDMGSPMMTAQSLEPYRIPFEKIPQALDRLPFGHELTTALSPSILETPAFQQFRTNTGQALSRLPDAFTQAGLTETYGPGSDIAQEYRTNPELYNLPPDHPIRQALQGAGEFTAGLGSPTNLLLAQGFPYLPPGYGRLASAGIAGQMGIENAPALLQDIQRGDVASGTQHALGLGIAGLAGMHSLHAGGEPTAIPPSDPRSLEVPPPPLSPFGPMPRTGDPSVMPPDFQTWRRNRNLPVELPQERAPAQSVPSPQITPEPTAPASRFDPLSQERADALLQQRLGNGWELVDQDGPRLLLRKGDALDYIDENGNTLLRDTPQGRAALTKKFNALKPKGESGNAVQIPSAANEVSGVGQAGQNLSRGLPEVGERDAGGSAAGTPAPEAAAARPAAPESPQTQEESVSTFRTSKGSTYQVHEDGTTTRNKVARDEIGHEGDSGLKPRSEKTVYVNPQDSKKLGVFQARHPVGKAQLVFDQGHVAVCLEKADGTRTIFRDSVVPYTETPEVGKTPVEVWNDGREAHFGNEIVEIGAKSLPVTPSEGATTGIAQRVHDVRNPGVVLPGEGWSPEEALQYGRDWVKAGGDAEQHLTEMKAAGNRVSGEDIGILRAHHERLSQARDKAWDAYREGGKTPDLRKAYDEAVKAEQDWSKGIKPYQTEFQRIGSAMQGETDIDTGSFTSLAQRYEANAKRPLNAAEERQAQHHADTVKGLNAEIERLNTQISEALQKEIEKRGTRTTKLPSDPTALREHFQKRIEDGSLFRQPAVKVPKGSRAGAVNVSSAPNFTAEEIQAIWNHAKTYIDRHISFEDMVKGVSSDLGLEPEWIKRALTQNKTTRPLSTQMYQTLSKRRQAVASAKAWVAAADKPAYVKFLKLITTAPRSISVFGHGGVGMVTHAGPNIFRPTVARVYWRNFFRQLPYVFKADVHELAMQNIENDSNFPLWKRAGLKVDPTVIYDDYQAYGKLLGSMGRAGNRGMDALKSFRIEYANQIWNGLPENLRQEPDMAPLIAEWVNHASGAGSLGEGAIANVAHEGLFAGSLEAGRWARVLGDPIKTAKTFATWKTATPAEQFIAKWRVKRAAELVSVYLGALTLNYGIQSALGTEDKVNLTDPTKSDWLRFKVSGSTYDPTGGAVAPLRFLAEVLGVSTGLTPTYHGQSKSEQLYGDAGFYLRGKLAPQYGILADVMTQRDTLGRPVPFSEEEGTNAKPRYTYPEYAWAHSPIPVSGAMREVYDTLRDDGIEDKTAHTIVGGLTTLGIEFFGVRKSKTPQ